MIKRLTPSPARAREAASVTLAFTWHLAATRPWLTASLSLLAALAVIAATLPQAPSELANDSIGTARWLVALEPPLPALSRWLEPVGFFSVKRSLLWKAIWALTFVGLAVQVARAWLAARGTLRRPGELSFAIAGIGGLLIIGGLWVSQSWGWAERGLRLVPEGTITLNHSPEVQISMTGAAPFAIEIRSGEEPRSVIPARRGWLAFAYGISWHVIGEVPALMVEANDQAGGNVPLQRLGTDEAPRPHAILTFSEPNTEADLVIPDRALALRIVHFPSGQREESQGHELLVQAFRVNQGQQGQDEPAFSLFTDPGSELQIDGVILTMQRVPAYVIDAVHDPGRWLMLPGTILLALGGLAQLFTGLAASRPKSAEQLPSDTAVSQGLLRPGLLTLASLVTLCGVIWGEIGQGSPWPLDRFWSAGLALVLLAFAWAVWPTSDEELG